MRAFSFFLFFFAGRAEAKSILYCFKLILHSFYQRVEGWAGLLGKATERMSWERMTRVVPGMKCIHN